MILGYNTNGWAHHDLMDAIEILAEIGYQSIAITIDHHALNPRSPSLQEEISLVRELLRRHRLLSCIETGARFLLDPRRKHEPSLLSPRAEERARRLSFYYYAVDCAAALGSECVSIWSGKLSPEIEADVAWEWLRAALTDLLDYAAARGVRISFEPEPDMWIDRLEKYEELVERLGTNDLWLTVDIGHLQCQGELPITEVLPRFAGRIANIHLEDMRRNHHEHLFFGEGEIDFRDVFRTLVRIRYSGPIHVELPLHSGQAPQIARRAYEFLQNLLGEVLPS
jgi:sugar phosphate isomerase/epimerase